MHVLVVLAYMYPNSLTSENTKNRRLPHHNPWNLHVAIHRKYIHAYVALVGE